jgi:hypothetical protein
MAATVRAALYLRVSTGRQADNDLSIPDQRRQAKAYCASRGWEIAADYVEPGASATDDRRPEFQRMIDAWRNDTENREEWQIQVLHLLHQGPAGRDRLHGSNCPYGKAR